MRPGLSARMRALTGRRMRRPEHRDDQAAPLLAARSPLWL